MSEPTPSDTEQPPARSSTYLRSGVVALVVVAAIGFVINLLVLQRHTNPTVDGHEIAQLISQGIQANSGIATPPQVACPTSVPASESSFNCTLEKDTGRVIVEVHRAGSTFTWKITNRPAG
jgi:hypothetical protein